ncbi:MAG: GNAT family N-acetyltransferase [Bacteroidota bacterium]
MSTLTIRFRPLTDDDLPMMHRWLNDPAVVEWWEGEDVSWPAVVSDYGSGHGDPVEHWIALLDPGSGQDAEPLGWIQCYGAETQVDDETYYWREHLTLHETAGIDYLIGEARHRGKGAGAAMIRAFVRDVVFPRHPEWVQAAAGPFEANVASWKALEAAGFTRRAVLDDEEGPCVLMVLTRDDLQGD